MHKKLLPVFIAALCSATSAHAAITSGQLIAIGSLNGSAAGSNTDLSGLTGTLENGVAANNLGGIGSALAYAGGNTFIATPDRGPNATSYNSGVDDTTSYISRFHTLTLALTANTYGSGLAYNLTPTLTGTTLLSNASALNYGNGGSFGLSHGAPALNAANNTHYFTGRSDNFGANNPLGSADTSSANPSNGRFDPEGVRVSNDGKSVFISDEYGPYVNQFDRATGQLIKSFTLPAHLAIANLAPTESAEISANSSGRVTNKGMEGLAITPDGKTLIGVMQAPLLQDKPSSGRGSVRIVTIDIASGATREFAYHLTNGTGVSEILAINDHEFLVDERDGKGLGDGSNAAVKQVFKIDLNNATDVGNLSGAAVLDAKAVDKTLFLDVVQKLNGENGVAKSQIPAKMEGLAFGPDITDNGVLFHTLYLANDNDFVPNVAGPNQFYVFAIADTDINYQAQQLAAVPVPGAVWLFGSALLGLIGITPKAGRSKNV